MHRCVLQSLLILCAGCGPFTAGTVPAQDWPDIDAMLDSMPLRDRIAQLIMPWMPGTFTGIDEPEFRRMVRLVDSLHVGGVIVSIGSPLEIAARNNALQRRASIPLLVASDLESGTRFRLTGGTPFPPNMGVAAGGRERDAWEIGRVTALEGRAVGIHMAFAPDADVNSNPANPIINTRSFGEDPAAVGRFTAAAIRGIQSHGMLATAKHFPGHGDTDTDSHLALPVIRFGWTRLDSLELVPFRAAIAAGVDAVMSAHIALPALAGGDVRPATVMPEVLTGVLRDSLGFRGLVVTDALTMAGVVDLYGAGEASVLAFLAGADLLLMPTDPVEAVHAMAAAVTSGRISESRLNASVRRVLALKKRLGLFHQRLVPLDSVMNDVGTDASLQLADDIAARSIVLAKDDGTVDSLRSAPRRVELVMYGEGSGETVGTTLAAELKSQGHTVTTHRLRAENGTASFDSLRAPLSAPGIYRIFAVAVRAVAWRGAIGLPAALTTLIDSTATHGRTVVVSFGSPYVAMQTPSVGAYLVAWASFAPSERAAGRALSGAAISGRLPIAIPPLLNRGAGLRRSAESGWQ